jgi:hypothetical protein
MPALNKAGCGNGLFLTRSPRFRDAAEREPARTTQSRSAHELISAHCSVELLLIVDTRRGTAGPVESLCQALAFR